jgi:hypothetical protein
MNLRKYWRELYLTVMVSTAITIIVAACFFFREDLGLGVIASGVFVSVLGVGLYDQWQDAELAKVQNKSRR